jgi:hypothetical protein
MEKHGKYKDTRNIIPNTRQEQNQKNNNAQTQKTNKNTKHTFKSAVCMQKQLTILKYLINANKLYATRSTWEDKVLERR